MSILLKRNNTSGLAPIPEEMVPGELAVNTTDGTIYTKKEDGTIIAVASASDLPLPTSIPWTSVTGKPALAAQVHTCHRDGGSSLPPAWSDWPSP